MAAAALGSLHTQQSIGNNNGYVEALLRVNAMGLPSVSYAHGAVATGLASNNGMGLFPRGHSTTATRFPMESMGSPLLPTDPASLLLPVAASSSRTSAPFLSGAPRGGDESQLSISADPSSYLTNNNVIATNELILQLLQRQQQQQGRDYFSGG